jgi:formylglycine-generating enzyme required for sulfatase activity
MRSAFACFVLVLGACGERAAPLGPDRPDDGERRAARTISEPGRSPTATPPPVADPMAQPVTQPVTQPAELDNTESTESATEPVSEPVAPCPSDMAEVGRFCIDRYEAPNVAGEKPLLMQSAHDGDAWCNERGKRLCREREWVRACGGPNGWNYPYGIAYRRGTCNDDKTYRVPRWAPLRAWPSEAAIAEAARLDQSEPSGSRADCVSAEGVFDLTGNVAEWVVRTEDNPTNHAHVVKGCYWNQCFRPPHAPACDYVNYAHQGAERSYEMGFRCCRDRRAP